MKFNSNKKYVQYIDIRLETAPANVTISFTGPFVVTPETPANEVRSNTSHGGLKALVVAYVFQKGKSDLHLLVVKCCRDYFF